MKTLAKLIILNLVGLYLSQDVEFFNCPTIPRVPDFAYRDLSALSVAIIYNSTEDIETFLNSGCNINDDRAYRSEIKTECDNPLFKQLGIECKTEVIYAGYTPLNLAVVFGTLNTVRRLLRVPGIDVDKASNWTSNPLFNAVVNGNLDMVEALVEAGADINFKGGNGDLTGLTPLITAAATGKKDIARYLISRGARLNEVDDEGISAAGAAIATNNVDILKLLGNAGADLRQLQGSYRGPLIRDAARNVEAGAEMVQYLIRKGADVNQEDGSGNTPLFHAAIFGNTRVADLLLRAGADIDHLNSEEKITALYAAIIQEKPETAQFLIKKGANVNLQTSDGFGPAYAAVGQNDLDTLKALTAAGADLNTTGGELQFSPMMYAAYQGYVDIVRFLKNQGVDLSLKDTEGDDALDLAELRNHEEVIQILREK